MKRETYPKETKNVINISIAGSKFAGKTELCNTITNKKNFFNKYIRTIGLDIMSIQDHDKLIKLLLTDLSGDNKYMEILSSYIKKSDIILFCYSCENDKSINKMINCYNYYNNKKYLINKSIIIVVTKHDLINKSLDSIKRGKLFANANNYPFIKVSSKTKKGIQPLINTIYSLPNYMPVILENVVYKKLPYKLSCCLL
jgi:small GTP-binding protein